MFTLLLCPLTAAKCGIALRGTNAAKLLSCPVASPVSRRTASLGAHYNEYQCEPASEGDPLAEERDGMTVVLYT